MKTKKIILMLLIIAISILTIKSESLAVPETSSSSNESINGKSESAESSSSQSLQQQSENSESVSVQEQLPEESTTQEEVKESIEIIDEETKYEEMKEKAGAMVIENIDSDGKSFIVPETAVIPNRQFISFVSAEGHQYYLIIEYAAQGNEGYQNVHLLKEVSDSDLEALTKTTKKNTSTNLNVFEKEEVLSPTTDTTKLKEEENIDTNPQKNYATKIIFGIIAVAALIGVMLYLKSGKSFLKKKETIEYSEADE